MRSKIIRSFMVIFLSSFVIGFGILYGVLYQSSLHEQTNVLFEELSLIESTDMNFNEEIGTVLKERDSRLTIITVNGDVLFDNFKSDIQENHLEREEIKEALKTGKGSSIRHSDTMNMEYMYSAIYDESDNMILRLAMPFTGISQSALLLLPSFCIAFLFALFFVWFLSRHMASSIMKPLQDISYVIRKANFGKEEIVFSDYLYPELTQITEAIQTLNHQVSQNLEVLEKEKQVRQEFFTNASHELKTPLTSIRGYSELLRSHTITEPDKIDRCLDCVLKESDHMTRLINDILTISKLETKDYKVMMSHIKVRELLNNILESLKVQADQMQLEINSYCDDIIVYASLDHVQAILYNLISNAIKYNKVHGKVYVNIRSELSNMVLKVSDTGIGISKEDQERMFQRFYRVDKQRSKKIAGTGLGLAIVKHIVQFYKGEINLSSVENQGTKIQLILPIVVDEPANS